MRASYGDTLQSIDPVQSVCMLFGFVLRSAVMPFGTNVSNMWLNLAKVLRDIHIKGLFKM